MRKCSTHTSQRATTLGAEALPTEQRCAPARCVPVRCELCNHTPSKGSLHSNAVGGGGGAATPLTETLQYMACPC